MEGLKWWYLKTGLEAVGGGREKGLVWRSWTVVGIRVRCRWDRLIKYGRKRRVRCSTFVGEGRLLPGIIIVRNSYILIV